MAIAKDDIRFDFYVDGRQEYYLRVAIRHGHDSAPRIAAELQRLLRDGVKVKFEVESPSRFAKES